MAEFLEGIEGYDEVEVTDFGTKPEEIKPGAYVLKISNAKIERFSAESVAIKIAFDIEEGEFKGYYQKLYDYNKSGQFADQAKWKGTFYIYYPTASDPDKKKQQIATFKRYISAINDSNPQKAPIDPTKKFSIGVFKGKLVGGAFGLKEWDWEGKTGTTCICRWLVGVDRVRAGEVETPRVKTLNGSSHASQVQHDTPAQTDSGLGDDFEEIISDGEIPF